MTAQQEERIQKDIVDKTPDQMKLSFALWNAKAVSAYIKQCFLMNLPLRSVRRYLNRWGFTPQRPMKQAFEQKPEAVRKWLAIDYSAIAERAKAEGAEIYWGPGFPRLSMTREATRQKARRASSCCRSPNESGST